MAGPYIFPKIDQNAKRSVFRKPLTELMQSILVDSYRLAPIRDLWELESHLQSGTQVEALHKAMTYEKVDLFSEKEYKQSFEKTYGSNQTGQHLHSDQDPSLRPVPLNLKRSEGNPTECRSRMKF